MMFSTNPFASSIHVCPPPNPFLDHEELDVYTDPFLSGDCCFNPPAPATDKQDLVDGLGLENSCLLKNKSAKKDHHSKVYTAQGPRDRRVRLSIEVARKFFSLQDILGFDKPSKTIDWLFTQSKISIEDLVRGNKQSEVIFKVSVKEGSDEHEKWQKGRSETKCVEGKSKKVTRKLHKSGFPVNQSRVEARARARERTKEKLQIKKIDNESKKVHGDHCSSNTTLEIKLLDFN